MGTSALSAEAAPVAWDSSQTGGPQRRGSANASANVTVANMAPSAAVGWWGTKVICPGYGFYSAACYGALQDKHPDTIIAWSGGVSTAALGYAINQYSSSAFASWVKTHPLYGWSWYGTAFEFYKAALSDSSVFSWLNKRLYVGMGCGLFYTPYLLHDFASAEDMAKALCTSGGESFTGSSTVNGVDLSTCADSFGGLVETATGGIPSHAKASIGGSSGYFVNAYNQLNILDPAPSDVASIVSGGWSDYTSITTDVNFETHNCLCSQWGCTFGC